MDGPSGSTSTGKKAIITHFSRQLDEVLADEDGASILEYVLIAILVAIASIGGMAFLGTVENAKFDNVAQKF